MADPLAIGEFDEMRRRGSLMSRLRESWGQIKRGIRSGREVVVHVTESRDMQASYSRLAGGVLCGGSHTKSTSSAKMARVTISGFESGYRE